MVLASFFETITSTIEKSLESLLHAMHQIKNDINVQSNKIFVEKLFKVHCLLISVLDSYFQGKTMSFDDEEIKKCFNYISLSFELRGEVFMEGMLFLCSFFNKITDKGNLYLKDASKYIMIGLDNYANDVECCNLTLKLISTILNYNSQEAEFMINNCVLKSLAILKVCKSIIIFITI